VARVVVVCLSRGSEDGTLRLVFISSEDTVECSLVGWTWTSDERWLSRSGVSSSPAHQWVRRGGSQKVLGATVLPTLMVTVQV